MLADIRTVRIYFVTHHNGCASVIPFTGMDPFVAMQEIYKNEH